MKRCFSLCILLAVIGLPTTGFSDPVVIANVPAYAWYHGCAPTATASIFGYWDLHGYNGLLAASGWSAVRLTDNVKQDISSDAHNVKYDPYPDAAGPDPSDTSLADFWHTSEGGAVFGDSSLNTTTFSAVFTTFAQLKGYSNLFKVNYPKSYAGYWTFGSQTVQYNWDWLKGQIDGGYPMLFLVTQTVNGVSNHFVPVVGYDQRGPNQSDWYYGFYSVALDETETVVWQQFKGTGEWGIRTMITIMPDKDLMDPIGLADAVLVLQTIAGLSNPAVTFHHDRNQNLKIDMADAIFILHEVADLRN